MTAPTTETPPQPAPESSAEEEVLAVLSIAFLTDGSVRVQSAGVKANQAWGAAELLRNMGNDLYDAARMEQARAQGKGRLVGVNGGRLG